jgi:hypothetical protein
MLIRQLDITGKKLTKREYKELIPRANLSVESAMIKIAPILQRVKAGRNLDRSCWLCWWQKT